MPRENLENRLSQFFFWTKCTFVHFLCGKLCVYSKLTTVSVYQNAFTAHCTDGQNFRKHFITTITRERNYNVYSMGLMVIIQYVCIIRSIINNIARRNSARNIVFIANTQRDLSHCFADNAKTVRSIYPPVLVIVHVTTDDRPAWFFFFFFFFNSFVIFVRNNIIRTRMCARRFSSS